jgi:hypothetical protein
VRTEKSKKQKEIKVKKSTNYTNLLASEHMRTTCFFAALKTLKKAGVYSSKCFEASVNSPKGPTPP